MEKHSESRLSYLFAQLHLLSSDLFSSDSSHLCFSTVHIVGSFTSKLPSIIVIAIKNDYYYHYDYDYDYYINIMKMYESHDLLAVGEFLPWNSKVLGICNGTKHWEIGVGTHHWHVFGILNPRIESMWSISVSK